MSVRIRLKRAGSKKRPFYRVVVIDSRRARDSRSIEDLGYYNPLEDPVVVNVDRERVSYWTSKGAQCSSTVGTLLKVENSTHPTRRKSVTFVEPTPEPTKPKKKKVAKSSEAAAKPSEAAAKPEAAAKSSEAAAKPEAAAKSSEAAAKSSGAAEAKAEAPAASSEAVAKPSEDAAPEETPAEKAPEAKADKADKAE